MELSLFSVSYAGYWGQQTLDAETFIEKAGKLGYSAVMLAGKRPHGSPLDLDDRAVARFRGSLERAGIRCGAVAGYTDFGARVAAEVPLLEMQIQYVEELCRVAQQLGAGLCRVFTSYEWDEESPYRVWAQTVRALQECCDRAAAFNVTLAVQNHHDIGVHSDALLEFLHDVDRSNCRLGADAWSPALRGEELYEAARKLAPHAVMTTSADYIRLPRYRYHPEFVNYEAESVDLVRAVPFGTGFIDYEAFFHGLRDGGFDGLATFEMCSPIRGGGSIENLDHYAQTYIRWMIERGFCPLKP